MAFYKKIVGDRIYLSPKDVSESTIERYTKWMNDFQVTDYTGRSSQVCTSNFEREYLERVVKDSKNVSFDIVALVSNKHIGVVVLENFKWVSRNATLGIFIGESEYRGKGYGAETINLILEYGFKYLNLHSVKLDLISCNERAHKCYLKCGFKDTGYTRDCVFVNGKYYDKLHMDILDTEFTGNYIRNKNI